MFASNTSQASDATFIEDVFSTYLYTGNGSTQTITNGINLAGKGGLVWLKSRSSAYINLLTDTVRGATNGLISNSTDAQFTSTQDLTAFGSTGFTIGTNNRVNDSTATFVSWTFRKQEKFFDVVTYTGNGANRTISHSLGSVPGCIIVKRTDTTADWQVYHRSLANTEYMVLNSTAAKATGTTRWNSTTPTSTVFSIGTDTTVNANGGTYVAYLFAHDAGGFGLTGTDNVISCGSFTTDGSGNATVTLGYEPQFVLLKRSSGVEDWEVYDSMRGMTVTSDTSEKLAPNSSAAATAVYGRIAPTATGFVSTGATISSTYIYIAIRRGPMKTPTSGTSVYNAVARIGTNANATISGVGFSPDLVLGLTRSGSNQSGFVDRLRGVSPTAFLQSINTSAEFLLSATANLGVTSLTMDGVTVDADQTFGYINFSTRSFSTYFFKRAPSFFDEVCYTGTGANRTVTHNLGVVPELMIVKRRDTTGDWWVYDAATGNTKYQVLNSTATPVTSATAWNNTTPTSSVFTVGTGATVNASGGTYVAYLFASCPGVSKVGTYTGNGTNQTINCGFTGGARFLMIKRTDSTGNWYVWDTARGIVTGNDPRLSLNSTATEVTTDDTIDPDNSGFIVNQLAATNVNVNAASYLFFAVA